MTLPNFPNTPTLGQTFNVGNATYECTAVATETTKAQWRVVGQADKGLRADLGAANSTVPIAGFQARQLKVIDGVKNLVPIAGVTMNVAGFYSGSISGGGRFYYDPSKNKTEHNGGTIIAPEALAAWNGTGADIATLLNWSSQGFGCFVRLSVGDVYVSEFGGMMDASFNIAPCVQKALEVIRVARFTSGVVRLETDVYVGSDRSIIGAGESYGGTVVHCYNNSAVKLGTLAEPRNTRNKISGLKFVSIWATDRTKFMLDGYRNGGAVEEGESFMNDISNVSFGDIDTGIVGEQMNGLALHGTANSISNVRLLGIIDASGNANVGLGIKDRGVNYYSNVQTEHNSRILLTESRSKFKNIHGERSTLELQNSSYCSIDGITCVDGTIVLDENSNLNDITGINGQNATIRTQSLFNHFEGATCGAEHGAYEFGLKGENSFVKPVIKATAWDSNNQRVYKVPSTGEYFITVLLKNRMGGATRTGSVEIYNLTSSAQLHLESFSLKQSSESGSLRNDASYTHSFMTVFKASVNDEIIVRPVTGDNAVIDIFLSQVDNTNATMLNGSAWEVAGAPAIVGESYYTSLQNTTPTFTAGKFKTTVSAGQSFSVTQFYTPKIAAKRYCAIIKGTWDGSLRLTVGVGAHDGGRYPYSHSTSGTHKLSDGKSVAILYFTIEDRMVSANRTNISFGGFANDITSANVEVDFCAVFAIGESVGVQVGASSDVQLVHQQALTINKWSQTEQGIIIPAQPDTNYNVFVQVGGYMGNNISYYVPESEKTSNLFKIKFVYTTTGGPASLDNTTDFKILVTR